MKRQPAAFLERFVGRLLPRASREHVLGDLSERYTSPLRYITDAGRTVPFVLGSQLRRSGWSAVPGGEAAALHFSSAFFLVSFSYVFVQLVRDVTTPRWFTPVWMLIMTAMNAFTNLKTPAVRETHASVVPSSLWTQKETLVRRIERLEWLLKTSAAPIAVLCAIPFLSIVTARMSNLAAPAFDNRRVAYSIALVLLGTCLGLLGRANLRRTLRNLQQQLGAL
jgi:hypothetical protein